MHAIANLILKFFKGFAVKYLTSVVLEKLVIELLRILAGKTDSKVDDRLVDEVFGKVK